jgi:hypothetical protein
MSKANFFPESGRILSHGSVGPVSGNWHNQSNPISMEFTNVKSFHNKSIKATGNSPVAF